jgi:hypothetical protein
MNSFCRVSLSLFRCLLLFTTAARRLIGVVVVVDATFHITPQLLPTRPIQHSFSNKNNDKNNCNNYNNHILNVLKSTFTTNTGRIAVNFEFGPKSYTPRKQSCKVHCSANKDTDCDAAETKDEDEYKYDEDEVKYESFYDEDRENEENEGRIKKIDFTNAEKQQLELMKLKSIETQKKRAIQFWTKSNYDDALKSSVHENVMKHLRQGLVLPIFHTLCRDPRKRLFSPNTTVCVDEPGLAESKRDLCN